MRRIYFLILTGMFAAIANAQCGDITTLTTSGLTASSVNLSWDVTSGAVGYEYAVTASATPPASGTATTNNFVTPVSGLTPVTLYYAHVRSDCGSNHFGNWNTVSFTTSCTPSSIPYTENFDGVTTPSLPACVKTEDVNGSTTWTNSTSDPKSGSNNMVYNYDEFTPGNDWFFTAPLSLTGSTSYRLSFWYRAESGTGIAYPEALEVKYGNTATASAMSGGTVLFSNDDITATTYQQFIIDFTPATTGTYYLGFHAISDANEFMLHVDDISVDVTPACASPTGINIVTTGATTASVSFTSGGNNFIVEYGAPGFSPGTGNTAGSGGTVVTGSASPINLTGLTGSSGYDVYVRQVCGGSSYSANSVMKAFLINDDAPGALTLTVNAGCTGAVYTNANATKSSTEKYPSCSGTSQAPVWFKFTAPASGAVRVTTDLGTGNTFEDSKLGLFSAANPDDYSTFNIISCDDDGGADLGFRFMSVLYATGLTPGSVYYVAVDKYDSHTPNGTFCISVDELSTNMLSIANTCADAYKTPVGSNVSYNGWVPLMDINSKLIALVRNPAGGSADAYTVSQNINTAGVRQDVTSKEYYLNRNYRINNSAATNVDVQFFFLNTELAALAIADPAATLNKLLVTRQTGTTCQDNFVAANGTNSELTQTGSGSGNGVSWITVNTPGFSNFFIHSTKSPIMTKVFLNGAYNAVLGRHKNVTPGWQNVLATNALNQPYNLAAFGNYNGGESVTSGFFTSDNTSDRDVVDWVLLELKDGSNNLVGRRAALVREDGKIIDTNGDSSITFTGLGSGSYYITIRHRNHLGISTQNLQAITVKALGVATPVTNTFDFTTETDGNIFGTAAAYKIIGGNNVMIGGNANSNNNVKYGGSGNDPSSILGYLGGSPTLIVNNVYTPNDLNMDGTVRYGGSNNDPAFLLGNALGGLPTGIVNEQKR